MNTSVYGRINRESLLKSVLLLVPLLGVLVYKYQTRSIAIGDTNVYFYTAYQMLQGKALYKDIIFTNFPLFPLISVLYFWATAGNIYLYYFTGAIESFVLALLIYYAVFIETKKFLPSLISSLLFSFSVYNLVSASFQTGIYTASIFAVGSYIFIRKEKPLFSGILMSLCFLTKAYFAPVLVALSYLAIITFKKEKVAKWILGLLAGLIPLVPFLFSSAHQMLSYLFGFSLGRSPSLNKYGEATSFVYFDFILLIPIFLIFKLKKESRNFWLFLFSLFTLFFLLFSDFYYAYFGMIVPFLVIAFGITISLIIKPQNYNLNYLLLIFLSAFLFFNILRHIESSKAFKVGNIARMVTKIEEIKPEYIYGKDIGLALSYLTKIPFPDNVVDTNPLLFRAGYIDKNKVTNEVVSNKSIVVAQGFESEGDTITSLPDIADLEVFNEKCSFLQSYPVFGRPPTTLIVLFLCKGKN